MMQLGADGVFVGSGIFKSGDPGCSRTGHREGDDPLTRTPRPSPRRAGASARRWLAGRWATSRKGSGSRPVAGNGETNGAVREEGGRNRVGVLALQGDFREHAEILRGLGVEPVEVRAVEI